MTACLLCQRELKTLLTFTQFLLLNEETVELCQNCRETFEKVSAKHCPACFKSGEENNCRDCRYWLERGKTVEHSSLYQYNTAMKNFFSRYKFQGDYALRYTFAEEIKVALKPYEKTHQLIPIPISRERMAERGFNQVTGFLEAARLKYDNLLKKEETVKQSSQNRKERLHARQSFSIKKGSHLKSQILLIDDIYTTGATLQLAKSCFQGAGVKNIVTFSLAR